MNRYYPLAILSVFLFAFLFSIHGKAQVVQWASRGGGTDNDYSSCIAADTQGNVYTIGTFTGVIAFGSNTLASTGLGDVFITKANAATGVFIWAKKLGSQSEDYGKGITTDNNGNVYCTGRFSGNITYSATTYACSGASEAFIAKIDPVNGAVAWFKKVGGTGADNGNAIASDDSGNIYTTGYFQGIATSGSVTLTPTGNNFNVFVIKTDATNGTTLWAKSLGGTGYNFGNSISCDKVGSIYVSGSMEGTAMFETFTLTSKGNTDIFIAQLDAASGDVLQAYNFGGPGNDVGNSLTGMPGGEIFTTGKFEGTVVFGHDTLVSAGSSDGFTIKQNAAGTVVWANRTGGTGYDVNTALGYDALGNVYTVGQFGSSMTLNHVTYYANGSADGYVARMNGTNGRTDFVLQAGGMGIDIATGISQDASGNIYVTGSFENITYIDNHALTAVGSADEFCVKINAAIVGIREQLFSQNTVQLYPNPFHDKIDLQFNDGVPDEYTVSVTDVSGRTIITGSESDPALPSKLSGLNPGIYYMIFKGKHFLPFTKTIIKE